MLNLDWRNLYESSGYRFLLQDPLQKPVSRTPPDQLPAGRFLSPYGKIYVAILKELGYNIFSALKGGLNNAEY